MSKDNASKFSGLTIYDNVNPKIVELYNNECVILDVGCGSGALGDHLKKLNPEAIVHGVDCSTDAGAIAIHRLDSFSCIDLDNQPLPNFDLKFDLIILGDVLEHLKRPDLFLDNLKGLLKIDGSIILSIPNVAYYRIRRHLFLGRFNYTTTGILDKTHLRFFTFDTLSELIDSCGYKVMHSRFISKHSDFLVKYFYRLFAIQFVLKIRTK